MLVLYERQVVKLLSFSSKFRKNIMITHKHSWYRNNNLLSVSLQKNILITSISVAHSNDISVKSMLCVCQYQYQTIWNLTKTESLAICQTYRSPTSSFLPISFPPLLLVPCLFSFIPTPINNSILNSPPIQMKP